MSAANVQVVDEEEFLGKARIYHRYRIPTLARTREPVQAVQQRALPFVTVDQERDLVDRLISVTDNETDALRQDKVRQVAAQESAELASSLTFKSGSRYIGFDEYIARHEEDAKLIVRLFHTDIPNPKQVHRFRAFRSQVQPSDLFLFNAPGSLVDSFLRRLATLHEPELEIYYPQLDLQKLVGLGASQIRGASFSISRRPNLKTAMVFGPDVNEDDSWDEYSQIGELTYVQILLKLETEEVKLMVTRRGSLLPYGLDDINQELRLCQEIYDTYIKPFEVNELPLVKRRRK